MQKLTTTDWVQIVATLAIVVSIVLVLVELRQNREIATAQLISDEWAMEASLKVAMLGESPSLALAKSCSHPSELTREDIEILDNYVQAKLAQIGRERQISALTGFYDEQFSIYGTLVEVLGTPYGRHSWEMVRPYWAAYPEVTETAEKVLGEIGEGCLWYDAHSEYLENQQ